MSFVYKRPVPPKRELPPCTGFELDPIYGFLGKCRYCKKSRNQHEIVTISDVEQSKRRALPNYREIALRHPMYAGNMTLQGSQSSIKILGRRRSQRIRGSLTQRGMLSLFRASPGTAAAPRTPLQSANKRWSRRSYVSYNSCNDSDEEAEETSVSEPADELDSVVSSKIIREKRRNSLRSNKDSDDDTRSRASSTRSHPSSPSSVNPLHEGSDSEIEEPVATKRWSITSLSKKIKQTAGNLTISAPRPSFLQSKVNSGDVFATYLTELAAAGSNAVDSVEYDTSDVTDIDDDYHDDAETIDTTKSSAKNRMSRSGSSRRSSRRSSAASSVGSYKSHKRSSAASSVGSYKSHRRSSAASSDGSHKAHRRSSAASSVGSYKSHRRSSAASSDGSHKAHRRSSGASSVGSYKSHRRSSASSDGSHQSRRRSSAASSDGSHKSRRRSSAASSKGSHKAHRRRSSASSNGSHKSRRRSSASSSGSHKARRRSSASSSGSHKSRRRSSASSNGSHKAHRRRSSASLNGSHGSRRRSSNSERESLRSSRSSSVVSDDSNKDSGDESGETDDEEIFASLQNSLHKARVGSESGTSDSDEEDTSDDEDDDILDMYSSLEGGGGPPVGAYDSGPPGAAYESDEEINNPFFQREMRSDSSDNELPVDPQTVSAGESDDVTDSMSGQSDEESDMKMTDSDALDENSDENSSVGSDDESSSGDESDSDSSSGDESDDDDESSSGDESNDNDSEWSLSGNLAPITSTSKKAEVSEAADPIRARVLKIVDEALDSVGVKGVEKEDRNSNDSQYSEDDYSDDSDDSMPCVPVVGEQFDKDIDNDSDSGDSMTSIPATEEQFDFDEDETNEEDDPLEVRWGNFLSSSQDETNDQEEEETILPPWMFGGDEESSDDDTTSKKANDEILLPNKKLFKRGKVVKAPAEGDKELHLVTLYGYHPGTRTVTVMRYCGNLTSGIELDDIEWEVDELEKKAFLQQMLPTSVLHPQPAPRAVFNGRNRGPGVLLESDQDARSIWLACRSGDLGAVMYCIQEEGVPFDKPEEMEGGVQGRTPLYWACLCKHAHIVKYLLELGARDNDGSAYICTNKEIQRLLIKYGHDGNGHIQRRLSSEKQHKKGRLQRMVKKFSSTSFDRSNELIHDQQPITVHHVQVASRVMKRVDSDDSDDPKFVSSEGCPHMAPRPCTSSSDDSDGSSDSGGTAASTSTSSSKPGRTNEVNESGTRRKSILKLPSGRPKKKNWLARRSSNKVRISSTARVRYFDETESLSMRNAPIIPGSNNNSEQSLDSNGEVLPPYEEEEVEVQYDSDCSSLSKEPLSQRIGSLLRRSSRTRIDRNHQGGRVRRLMMMNNKSFDSQSDWL